MGERYLFDSISWGLITIFNNGKIIPMENISKTAFNNASNKFIQICNFLLKLRYLYKWISKLNEFDGFLLKLSSNDLIILWKKIKNLKKDFSISLIKF